MIVKETQTRNPNKVLNINVRTGIFLVLFWFVFILSKTVYAGESFLYQQTKQDYLQKRDKIMHMCDKYKNYGTKYCDSKYKVGSSKWHACMQFYSRQSDKCFDIKMKKLYSLDSRWRKWEQDYFAGKWKEEQERKAGEEYRNDMQMRVNNYNKYYDQLRKKWHLRDRKKLAEQEKQRETFNRLIDKNRKLVEDAMKQLFRQKNRQTRDRHMDQSSDNHVTGEEPGDRSIRGLSRHIDNRFQVSEGDIEQIKKAWKITQIAYNFYNFGDSFSEKRFEKSFKALGKGIEGVSGLFGFFPITGLTFGYSYGASIAGKHLDYIHSLVREKRKEEEEFIQENF
jgi:flagellar biosynthesis GTPase FlhF